MTSKAFLKTTTAIITGGLLALPAISQVQAQETGAIEEIIVTATKRARNIQDVPVAVSAYSGELMRNSGAYDVRDLVGLAPSLYLSTSQSETAGVVARIRGVGTTGDNPGLESAVGIFIDGVYRNRSNVGLTELGEIERVEVLRGPQGTLFGRNTSAGIIHIITKGPEFEAGGYAEAGYGNHDNIRITGGLTGPIGGDSAAARVDVVYAKRDGFLNDVVTGDDFNDRDRLLIRGQVQLEPSENVSIRLIADYADRDETCCAATTIVRGPTAAIIEGLGGQLASGGPFDRASATTPGLGFGQNVEEFGVSGQLDWDFEAATLTSITSYRDWDAARSMDVDFTSLDILRRDPGSFSQEFKTFSQEVRLNGVTGKLDWLVGVIFADEDLTLNDAIRPGSDYLEYLAGRRVGASVIPGLFQVINPTLPTYADLGITMPAGSGAILDTFLQNSKSWAFFTHNTFDVTDRLQVTAGIRYTSERKKIDGTLLSSNQACLQTITHPAFGPGGPLETALALYAGLACLPFFNPLLDGNYVDSKKETEWSGTAKIAYRFSDNVMTYASYARGYKAGGFNLDRAGLDNPLAGGVPEATDLRFPGEFVDSFELAAKTSTTDKRMNFNVTLFYQDFKDFQLNTFNGISFVVNSLPEVIAKGVELELIALPVENFALQGGLTYASTKYGDQVGTPATLANKQITNAPKISITGAASYENEIASNLLGFIHVDARLTGKINTGSDLDVEKIQKSTFIVNARMGIGNLDKRWSLEFWSRNVFNKNYIQIGFDAPLQDIPGAPDFGPGNTQTFNAFLAEPRTFGIALRGTY